MFLCWAFEGTRTVCPVANGPHCNSQLFRIPQIPLPTILCFRHILLQQVG